MYSIVLLDADDDQLASSTTTSGIPQPGPQAGTTESTPIAPTGDIPSKLPGSEKQ